MASIFDESNKVEGNWMKFRKIGDYIEGTLVGRREVPSQFSSGNQIIYELKVTDVVRDGQGEDVETGDLWNVGGKFGIDQQMKTVRVGQVIGMKFESTKKNPRPGFNDTKIIQIYANKDIVDEQWLQEQEVAEAAEEEGTAAEQLDAKMEEKEKEFLKDMVKPIDEMNEAEMKEEIIALAKEKLGAKSDDEVSTKAMEATELAFIDKNFPDILVALRQK